MCTAWPLQRLFAWHFLDLICGRDSSVNEDHLLEAHLVLRILAGSEWNSNRPASALGEVGGSENSSKRAAPARRQRIPLSTARRTATQPSTQRTAGTANARPRGVEGGGPAQPAPCRAAPPLPPAPRGT